MKILNKIQRRAAIWILGAFKISSSERIEAIAGIIPIKFHLQKLAKRSLIHSLKLPANHIIRDLMDDLPHQSKEPNPYTASLLTNRQKNIAKGHLINSCNKSYGIFLFFAPLHQEFTPGFCLSDIFSDCFSLNLANKKEKDKDKICVQELNDMALRFSSSPNTALIVTDASIKNDIATSISHIHQANHPLIKTVHHAAFVTSLEAELFAIRCGINQACNKEDVSKIFVITNSIHAAKNIFNSSPHPYQLHSMAILSEL